MQFNLFLLSQGIYEEHAGPNYGPLMAMLGMIRETSA